MEGQWRIIQRVVKKKKKEFVYVYYGTFDGIKQ